MFMGAVGLSVLALVGCVRSGFLPNDSMAPQDGTIEPDASLTGLVSARQSSVLSRQYDVAFDGSGYAIAWVEYPAGSFQRRIMFALVSSQGHVVSGPQTLGAIEENMTYIELLARADRFMLFYQRQGDSGLDVMRVEPQADRFAVDHSYLNASLTAAQVAPAGDGFVIAYRSGVTCLAGQTGAANQIYLRQLDANATVLSSTGDPLECSGKTQTGPKLISTGSQHLVLWLDYRSGRINRYGLVDAELALVGGQTQPVATTPTTQSTPQLAHDGLDRALVTWNDDNQMMLRALDDSSGPLWDGVAMPIPANRATSLAWATAGGDGRFGLAWESDLEHTLTQIRFASLSSSQLSEKPSSLASQLLTNPDYGYCCPKLTRGAGGFAVVFVGNVAGEHGLFFKVVPDP
jgi:hypothetical protein